MRVDNITVELSCSGCSEQAEPMPVTVYFLKPTMLSDKGEDLKEELIELTKPAVEQPSGPSESGGKRPSDQEQEAPAKRRRDLNVKHLLA